MIKARRRELKRLDKDDLINYIINTELNDVVAEYADYKDDETGPDGRDKRVPYIGWFWRRVDFAGDYIPIGNCGEFIGFMQNNKWGYPQRSLTEDERTQVVAIVEQAHSKYHAGGILAEIIDNTKKELDRLWPLLQTFTIPISGYWIYGIQGRVAHAETAEDADRMIELLTDAAPSFQYRKVAVDE